MAGTSPIVADGMSNTDYMCNIWEVLDAAISKCVHTYMTASLKSLSFPLSAARPKVRLRDRQATEDGLIAAASTIFAASGYENATTRAIAERAGCSEALIQRYFNGKEGLLLAVLRQEDNEAERQFQQRPLCTSLEDEARELLVHAIDVLSRRSEKLRVVLSRVLIDSSFGADFKRISIHTDLKEGLEARLTRYRDAGMLSPDIDIKSVASLFMALGFDLGFAQCAFLQTELHRTTAIGE